MKKPDPLLGIERVVGVAVLTFFICVFLSCVSVEKHEETYCVRPALKCNTNQTTKKQD